MPRLPLSIAIKLNKGCRSRYCWGKQMGDEGKEKWSLFSPLLGVYSTRETGLIYPLNINKQCNYHQKIILVSVCGLISGLKLSAGYAVPQARTEWSVFRRDHLRPLWVPQHITAVVQVKPVSKKTKSGLHFPKQLLTHGRTESSEVCSFFSQFFSALLSLLAPITPL